MPGDAAIDEAARTAAGTGADAERAADTDAERAAPDCDPMTAPLPADRDAAAVELVRRYACAHLDKTDGPANFEVYIVWKCFVLGHCKWLVSTTLRDGMYYEVTYNAARSEYYLDVYKKFDNLCITAERRYA